MKRRFISIYIACLASWAVPVLASQASAKQKKGDANVKVKVMVQSQPPTGPSDRRGEADALQKINTFLKKDNKDLLVLLGSAKSGKTTLVKKVYSDLQARKQEQKQAPTPLFISLTDSDVSRKKELVAWFLREKKGYKTEEINQLKEGQRFVLILDGCDKLRGLRRLNLHEHFGLDEWNAITIVTCRSEALSHREAGLVFGIGRNKLNCLYLLPWSKQQTQKYTGKKDMQAFERYNLFNLPAHAVKIAAEISKEDDDDIKDDSLSVFSDDLQDWKWHRAFVNRWLQGTGDKRVSIEQWAKNLAVTMFENHKDTALPHTAGHSKHPVWGRFFKKEHRFSLLHAPVVRWGNEDYKFLFPSLREYFVAAALYDEIKSQGPVAENSIMSRRFLNGHHVAILTMLAEVAKNHEDRLMQIVKNRKNPIAAANALSILGKANMLKGKNLQGIRVSALARRDDNSNVQQGPYLDGVDLTECDFTGSDLGYAHLKNSNLTRSKFKHADLSWIDLSCVTAQGTDVTNAIRRGVIWPNNRSGFILGRSSTKGISIEDKYSPSSESCCRG